MTGAGAAELQVDEHLTGAPEDAASIAVEARLRDIHTHFPAVVKEFQAGAQTVKVQPAIRRIFTELGAVPLPQLVDVPVFFAAGGAVVQTFPIAAGDECLVAVAERAIDAWFKAGDVQDPSETRLFDLSDSFAFVGISSQPRWLANVNTTAYELRTRDGAMVLRFSPGKILLGVSSSDATTEPVPGGNTAVSLIGQICDAIQQITVPTAMGPSGVPVNAAAFASIKSQLSTMLSTRVEVKL